MTKMATMFIYGKNFKCHLLWNQKAIGFGTWHVTLGSWALPGWLIDWSISVLDISKLNKTAQIDV